MFIFCKEILPCKTTVTLAQRLHLFYGTIKFFIKVKSVTRLHSQVLAKDFHLIKHTVQ